MHTNNSSEFMKSTIAELKWNL